MGMLRSPWCEVPDRSKIWLYHITSWRNLAGIIGSGGLWCSSEGSRHGLNPISAAHPRLVERRAAYRVSCPPSGTLADYEPFAFAPRSPMLCAIAHGKVAGVSQEEMVHLGVRLERVLESDVQWVFTDGHAAMQLSRFWNAEDELSRIDWPLMKEEQWANTESDSDRSRRRQAEFLIHRFVPWDLVDGIGVFDERIKIKVEQMMEDASQRSRVRARKEWYY